MGRTETSTLGKVPGMSHAGLGSQVGLPSTSAWGPAQGKTTGLEGGAGLLETTVPWIPELTSVTDPLLSHSL